jgi:5-formyltetrahydrofolate cyclo-ligase
MGVTLPTTRRAAPCGTGEDTAMSGYAAGPATEGKRALRARLRAARRERVPGRDRAADAAWIAREGVAAVEAAGVRPGQWVSTFESTPSEPPTDALVAALAARGIRVMVPLTLPDLDLDWAEAGTGGPPLGREAIGEALVVFVPALAVDRHGTRLGQGGGSYDRSLPRAPHARLVALVHPWEVVDEPLPREPHDRVVEAVLSAGLPVRTLPLGGGS